MNIPSGKRFVLLLLICVLASPAAAQHLGQKRGFLTSTFSLEDLRQQMTEWEDWNPYPRAGEEGWENVPEAVRKAHIQEGEKLLGTEWDALPATVFLEFVRTGNRSNFQDLSYGRREKLAKLVLAEAIENEGRFLDDIVNGIWEISEETYWGVPAHLNIQARGHGLPDVNEPTVDLFAAETASLMAWTDYLLGSKLDEISPLVRERIRTEVDRRILTPNFERDDFWWMGFSGGLINNWNPWVNSNWLTAVLLLEEDEERRVKAIYKIMRSLDRFIDSYPEDGGCDEGPNYWSRAGGSLFDTLELLYQASGGRIDIYEKPLIEEMGKFIYRSYIGDSYFINFADASAKINVEPALIYLYGQRIQDSEMMGFAAYVAQLKGFGRGYISGRFGHLARQLPTLFAVKAIHETAPREPLISDFWLKDIQVMGARSAENTREGFYLAAKGGHNDESHNHNDIGNIIVYHNGLPALIDVGAGIYTAKTFSDERYTIWTMQSAYHNVPTINDVMQMNGRQYAATDVSFEANPMRVSMQLDIAGAYPDEARASSWLRYIEFDRPASITIRDRYELDEYIAPSELHYMTPREADVVEPGVLVLRAEDSGGTLPARDVFMHYDSELLKVNLERIPLEDTKLISGWGEKLMRISFISKSTDLKGEFELRIED